MPRPQIHLSRCRYLFHVEGYSQCPIGQQRDHCSQLARDSISPSQLGRTQETQCKWIRRLPQSATTSVPCRTTGMRTTAMRPDLGLRPEWSCCRKFTCESPTARARASESRRDHDAELILLGSSEKSNMNRRRHFQPFEAISVTGSHEECAPDVQSSKTIYSLELENLDVTEIALSQHPTPDLSRRDFGTGTPRGGGVTHGRASSRWRRRSRPR